ncbi:MAG TPA: GTP cyclohydrolase II [Acetobacteraceae bacterium]|nr:GTP cyclohydrolase II [Acetobacteraceae bacterium]
MTRLWPRADPFASAELTPAAPDEAGVALRVVRRAAADLAAGVPLLLAGEPGLVVLAAETASGRAIQEFTELAAGPPILLLAAGRAAALLRRPLEPGQEAIGVRLGSNKLDPELLLKLADQTAGQPRLKGELEPAGALPAAAPAALALAKQARLLPAALVAPSRKEAGEIAARLGILSVDAADVLACSPERALHLQRVSEARVPLEAAPEARIIAFRVRETGAEHVAILIGRPEERATPLVRVHSQCFTGDLLGSLRCDCGAQLRGAIARIAEEGAGALLYLAQEGRGIGLTNKLRAYRLQDGGLDTVEANKALGWGSDERGYRVAAAMLAELGLERIRLLTNNPEKLAALRSAGIEITARVPLVFPPNGVNDRYLATKAGRLGHLLAEG